MSNETQHTPGPWATNSCIIFEDNTSITIATVKEEANARLIAAAPDLLKALIACKAYMLGETTKIDLIETDKMASEAITKATSA